MSVCTNFIDDDFRDAYALRMQICMADCILTTDIVVDFGIAVPRYSPTVTIQYPVADSTFSMLGKLDCAMRGDVVSPGVIGYVFRGRSQL